MSIASYASNCRSLIYELKESLSEDDIYALQLDVSGLGVNSWFDFLRNTSETIKDFQHATPAKRDRLKKFQEPVLKRRLVLASIQRLIGAHELLCCMMNQYYEGKSYRDAAALAADDYRSLASVLPYTRWPFDCDPPHRFQYYERTL